MSNTRRSARTAAVPEPRATAAGSNTRARATTRLDEHVRRLSPAERAARGRRLRADVSRRRHAEFDPTATRRDPLGLFMKQSVSRMPDLVPIRYGRMLASPFAYFRGAAPPMAHDLSATPVTGIAVQACGDAHLSNFGVYGSAERRLVFDINDFDETLPGPWEWDVKRLAASLEIVARDNGVAKRQRNAIVRSAVGRYRIAMGMFAAESNLNVWYASADMTEIVRRLNDRLSLRQRQNVGRGIAKAKTRDSMQAFAKLCDVVDGKPRIVADPPLVVPLASLLPGDADPTGIEAELMHMLAEYRGTLEEDRRYLLDQYQYEFADIARKVVGVGSVGTRCWIMLVFGRDESDPLFLQIKEAGPSVLSAFAGPSRFDNQGQRVVEGQRLMQAASDIFLGWLRQACTPDGVSRDFYVRQLRDWKFAMDPRVIQPSGLSDYGEICGWTLARAHARSGDRIAIAAYLGSSDVFDRAVAAFAASYADQNERDFAAFEEAARSGRILAQRGL